MNCRSYLCMSAGAVVVYLCWNTLSLKITEIDLSAGWEWCASVGTWSCSESLGAAVLNLTREFPTESFGVPRLGSLS